MFLSNKIPPPLVMLICVIAMYFVAGNFTYTMDFIGNFWRISLAVLLLIVAVFFMLSGVWTFKKQKTTVNPLKPEEATTLVVIGVYRFSRNPMYFGMLLMLLAYGIYLNNALSLTILPLFVAYIYFFQIKAEERAMEKLFGEAFQHYKSKVRTWI